MSRQEGGGEHDVEGDDVAGLDSEGQLRVLSTMVSLHLSAAKYPNASSAASAMKSVLSLYDAWWELTRGRDKGRGGKVGRRADEVISSLEG